MGLVGQRDAVTGGHITKLVDQFAKPDSAGLLVKLGFVTTTGAVVERSVIAANRTGAP